MARPPTRRSGCRTRSRRRTAARRLRRHRCHALRVVLRGRCRDRPDPPRRRRRRRRAGAHRRQGDEVQVALRHRLEPAELRPLEIPGQHRLRVAVALAQIVGDQVVDELDQCVGEAPFDRGERRGGRGDRVVHHPGVARLLESDAGIEAGVRLQEVGVGRGDEVVADDAVDVPEVAHSGVRIVGIGAIARDFEQPEADAARAIDDDVLFDQRVAARVPEVDRVLGKTGMRTRSRRSGCAARPIPRRRARRCRRCSSCRGRKVARRR